MKPLDFVIIGAQKSATTALFKYLEGHPDIEMPAAKEAPFFTADHEVDEDWQAYVDTQFTDSSKLWGKATPQYMGDYRVPERLAKHCPEAKLIAILRDPIDRAYSHFQMGQRRDTESRGFDQVVLEELQPQKLVNARLGVPPLHEMGYVSEGEYYFVWGEYGRILENYLLHFPRSQLLVLTTAEIKQQPAETLDKVLDFIGADTGYRPEVLGQVIHKGGKQSIIPTSLPRRIVNLPILKQCWQAVPDASKHAVRYWFEQLNVRKGPEKSEQQMSAQTEQKLVAHYKADIERLNQLFELDLPWRDKYEQ